MHILTFNLCILQECFSMHAHKEVDYVVAVGCWDEGFWIAGLGPVAFLSVGLALNQNP